MRSITPHTRTSSSHPCVPLRKRARDLLVCLLVMGLMTLSPGVQHLAQADPLGQGWQDGDYQVAMERLDEVMSVVDGLRESLDRSRFDVEELGFELAFEDAEFISDWVADNISYQPYQGLLRGPQGTLMSGAGNALDQAVLLALLLTDAGYEVRVALGTLEPDRAAELVDRVRAPQRPELEPMIERLLAELDSLPELPGLSPQALREPIESLLRSGESDSHLLEEAHATSAGLILRLRERGVVLEGSEERNRIVEEARQYAWVEYRLSPADAWIAAHPAWQEIADAGLEAERYLDGEVPAEMQHRLRVEVKVERKVGDELEVVPVMAPWERPVANMIGKVLTYSNVPSGLDPALPERDVAAVLDDTEYFIPNFNSNLPDGAQAFDLEGTILSPDVAGDQAAGVFREVNRSTQQAVGALGALGGDGKSGDSLALTAQWIDYTLISPDGSSRSYRRMLFDRVGAHARESGLATLEAMGLEEAELALLTEHRIMALPAHPGPAYLLDQFLARFAAARPFLEYVTARLHGVEPQSSIADAIASASPLEHLLTVELFDGAAEAEEGLIAYRAEPTVVVFRDGLAGTREDSRGFTSLDIVHNARRMLRREGGTVQVDVEAAVSQGVWETVVERELLAAENSSVVNATGVVQRALAAGIELRVLTPGDDLEGLPLTVEAAENLERDLELGYAVVVPESFAPGDDPAWWRIRPGTGETLGMTSDGRGQALTEYTIQLYDMGFTVMFAVKSLNDCEKQHGGDGLAHACCLVKAHINNVAGLGIGSALGKAFGAAVVGEAGRTAGALAGLSFTLTSGVLGGDITGLDC